MRSVSIVVPAYNEALLLPGCLASLFAQGYPGPIEILVVDNASTDGTGDLARRAGVRVIEEPVRGYGRALRSGFAAARGEIIAATDADSIVPCDWIARLVATYDAHPDVVAVGGAIEFMDPNRRGRLLTDGLLPLVNRIDRANPAGPHLWGANLSVRRDAFERIGGWNPDFSFQADTELSERLRAEGRVVLLEDLRVRTSSRRWNHALASSVFQSASNFVWFHGTGHPLWREFAAIREARAPVHPRRAPRRRHARTAMAAFATLWAMGVLYTAFAPWSHAFGRTEWSATTSSKIIALTFDDGPEEPYTSQVLATLEKERVPATFFLVGENVELDPDAAARMARDGDAIGNHTDNHTPAFALEPEWLQARDLTRAERTIHQATGIYPHLFRPPQGLRSPWLMALVASDSLLTVTWDDAPRDWERRTPKDLVRSTLAQAHPGAIILLHDGLNLDHRADRSATVAALPGIIAGLRAEGYRFVTVPELLHEPARLRAWHPGGRPRLPEFPLTAQAVRTYVSRNR
jgi:peptidoglycan/xylan/chitin deacetylase (PgdA/CDA1 family)